MGKSVDDLSCKIAAEHKIIDDVVARVRTNAQQLSLKGIGTKACEYKCDSID